jgi:hypothetical protein
MFNFDAFVLNASATACCVKKANNYLSHKRAASSHISFKTKIILKTDE